MHFYGDEDFKYWADLDKAAVFIGDVCRTWGRISVRQVKEKYGTVRVYCSLYCENLHDLFYPGYVYIQHKPYRLWTFPFFVWLRFLTRPYQKFVYRLAYQLAVKKWPHITKEILCCADWPELLKGLGYEYR
jgi:hypothetical protein